MRYSHPTLERVRELLDYDPASGVFFWKVRPYRNSRRRPGDEAGILKPTGANGERHRYIGIDRRAYTAAQLAFFLVHERWPTGRVGFKDGDGSNTKAENIFELRTAALERGRYSEIGNAAYQRAHRAANPAHYRNIELRRTFGISLEEYNAMLAAQGGVCAICRQPERAMRGGVSKNLAVDHDHITNKVRALLCSNCNPMIGYAGDDPVTLRAAAAYIENFRFSEAEAKETA